MDIYLRRHRIFTELAMMKAISFVFMIIERYDEYLSALFYVGIAGTFLNICWGKRKG